MIFSPPCTLAIVESNPGLSQTRVADALGIKKANFVGLIRELEARNLVARPATPGDRRSVSIELTAAGRDLITLAHEASATHEAAIRERVGAEAYDALFAPLGRIAGLG